MTKVRYFSYGVVLAGIAGTIIWWALSSQKVSPSALESAPENRRVSLPKEPPASTPQLDRGAAPNVAPRLRADAEALDEARSVLGSVCTSDVDCRGPRTPDCVLVSCEQGHCVADDAKCGCKTTADCNDGDPCTRDLCFARTKKCIFIPKDCD